MFTVLVKKPNGHETLYECSELEKEENALLLRGPNLGGGANQGLEILGPLGQTMSWDWDRKISQLPGQALSQDVATVFVMNNSGKTIATYSL